MADINFAEWVGIRPEEFEGEKNWHWIRDPSTGQWDQNSWAGPTSDWTKSHKQKYFAHVRDWNLVITAGANHGLHCRQYARKFKTVYAFEPIPLTFYALNLNTTLFPNVFKFQAALSETGGTLKMIGQPLVSGCYGVDLKSPAAIEVPCLTIDSLNLPACDLIQLDVEGWENQALCGATETILKYQPVIITERGGPLRNMLVGTFNYVEVGQSVADMIWKPKKFL